MQSQQRFSENQLPRFDYKTILDRIRSRLHATEIEYPKDFSKIAKDYCNKNDEDRASFKNHIASLTIEDLKHIFYEIYRFEPVQSQPQPLFSGASFLDTSMSDTWFALNVVCFIDETIDETTDLLQPGDGIILQNILDLAQSLDINIYSPDCLPQEKADALISKPPGDEPLDDAYRERKCLNTPDRRACLPDNGWRMIQLLEKYSMHAKAEDKEKYASLIQSLMNSMYEENAKLVLQDIQSDRFSAGFNSRQLKALELASLTNVQLVDNAVNENDAGQARILRQEIEGRLLRSELFNLIPDIQLQLDHISLKRHENKGYDNLLQSIIEDFAIQARQLQQYFPEQQARVKNENDGEVELDPGKVSQMREDFDKNKDEIKEEARQFAAKRESERGAGSENSAKDRFLENFFINWQIPSKKQKDGKYVDVSGNLNKMRIQFLDLAKNLPDIKQQAEKDWHSLSNYAYAGFVALGCIFLPFIGIPLTIYKMYRSYEDKGTVFFTHASDAMRIPPAAKRSLKEMGNRIKLN